MNEKNFGVGTFLVAVEEAEILHSNRDQVQDSSQLYQLPDMFDNNNTDSQSIQMVVWVPEVVQGENQAGAC